MIIPVALSITLIHSVVESAFFIAKSLWLCLTRPSRGIMVRIQNINVMVTSTKCVEENICDSREICISTKVEGQRHIFSKGLSAQFGMTFEKVLISNMSAAGRLTSVSNVKQTIHFDGGTGFLRRSSIRGIAFRRGGSGVRTVGIGTNSCKGGTCPPRVTILPGAEKPLPCGVWCGPMHIR